ncbi:MAG TPA: HAD family phosphatase [Polyangiales bacterium]|nr:HAD family phosphatase [Polyangiales bacterium]
MTISAVIFDLGGVVLDSPLEVFVAYETELGIAPHTVNRNIVAAGHAGAWSRLERGELSMLEFYAAFDAEMAAQGLQVSGAAIMQRLADSTAIRPAALQAIRKLRAAGRKVAALTNNWANDDQGSKMEVLRSEFDVFIESTRVGLRKPDPRIYQLACSELGVEPAQTAFLDDIGLNLKAARALGMTTIKVVSLPEALAELSKVTGIALTT